MKIYATLTASVALMHVAAAAENGWPEWFAQKFSKRLPKIERELAQLTQQLENLPLIPVNDQGGTGGWAAVHPASEPTTGKIHAVEIRWSQAARVEWIALVPARRYDARGLDSQYGMPDSFSVELLDAEGKTAGFVAKERNARSHPVRNGHPFVYEISPPVMASGIRISAEALLPDFEDKGSFVHAWAEVFTYAGNLSLTRNAAVQAIGGSSPPAPWNWAAAYLVDGQTPLGLPEIPGEGHRNVGWLSEGRADPNVPAGVTADLAKTTPLNAIRLLPAKRPTSDLPSGFGFPRKLRVSVSDTGQPADWRVAGESEQRNPGHNPVLLPIEAVSARYVKIEATQLWKAFENYPAFFALSEVEILSGAENVAFGKTISSTDGMQNLIAPGGRLWTSAALSDGFGPDGRLVSNREWLTQLDARLRLETRRHDLHVESETLVASWRRTVVTWFAAMGLAGAFAIIALPIRYRLQANRELLKVRERIASDLHDEVGSNLGSIQMFADLAESRSGESKELKRIQRIAAETVSAVRDIVWLLRPGGDHRIATVEHLRETGSIMLESLKWKFTANEAAWQVELPEESNRDLFLYFREALHNILRHANASDVAIHAEASETIFQLSVVDNGCGISSEKLERPATLRALRQRAEALGGELSVDSSPDSGTRLELNVPLRRKKRRIKRLPPRS